MSTGHWLGKKLSEEHKKKLSLAHTGKQRPHSEETKKKIGEANRGKLRSEEWRVKQSMAHKGKKRGSFSEEHKKKISDAQKGKKYPERSGEKAWNWKGGYKNKLVLNRKYRAFRKGNGGFHTLGEWEVMKAQYNWTCPSCLQKEPEIILTADHIIPIKKGGSDNIENIQPLCKSCNSRKYTKTIYYDRKSPCLRAP